MKWSISAPELSGRPRCTPRPRICADKGAIWGPGFPNFQLSRKYQRGGPPCLQTRWSLGGKILSGRAISPSSNRRLPHCISTAQIGYWNGRFRAPNFLAIPTVRPALESASKGREFGATLSKFPTFCGISARSGPR